MHNKGFIVYLLGVFVTTIILIVFLQYNSYRNIHKLINGNESLIHEFEVSAETQKLQTDMLYIESEIHRAVIGEDSSYLAGIQYKEKTARERLLNLNTLLLTDSTKKLLEHLDSLINEKLKFGNNILNTLFTKGQSAAEEMYKGRKGKNAMGEIVSVLDSLNLPRQEYLTHLATEADTSGHRAKEWGIVLAITAGLSCIFTFWYITKKIQRQQQLYDQLNQSEKKVRQAGIMKENFMANMSHEIRTPMNAILGFTNLVQKEPLNEKSKGFVNSIQKSGESLLAIINDILDFSKIEAGMMRIESTPFSLRGLLQSVETMFASRVQPKNLKLSVNVEKSIPDSLIGDAVRLTQIMVNLVNNSVKFTYSGSIEIKVTADRKCEDLINISFFVKDTGIGIPTDKIDTIFERFQQADEDTTRKYGGTGLGLSIVKQLVELQHGTIHVSSVQNVGTEFVFTIPYIISHEMAWNDSVKMVTDDKIQLKENNIKILVAEDNAMNQNLMEHLLAGWKFNFDIVSNGKEAIEAIQRKNYNLVLMDIQMPQMDGYTATKKIRNEIRSDIPIVAMTAHAMAGEREKCLSYGMNEYIAKPIREYDLFKIINNFLGKSNEATLSENQVSIPEKNAFKMLDLQYLEELSGGNKVFEKSMLEQFLKQVPGELEDMQTAFDKANYVEAAQIAHNMKTSISFMGLTERLDPSLDYIEKNASIENVNTHVQEKIMMVKEICRQTFIEVKEYLARTY